MRVYKDLPISHPSLRSGLLVLSLILQPLCTSTAINAQTPEDRALRQAVSAYNQGEVERAGMLLDSVDDSRLSSRDRAIRKLYQGLVLLVFNEEEAARAAFREAVAADSTVHPDPGVHSPRRIQLYEEARDYVRSQQMGTARRQPSRSEQPPTSTSGAVQPQPGRSDVLRAFQAIVRAIQQSDVDGLPGFASTEAGERLIAIVEDENRDVSVTNVELLENAYEGGSWLTRIRLRLTWRSPFGSGRSGTSTLRCTLSREGTAIRGCRVSSFDD